MKISLPFFIDKISILMYDDNIKGGGYDVGR